MWYTWVSVADKDRLSNRSQSGKTKLQTASDSAIDVDDQVLVFGQLKGVVNWKGPHPSNQEPFAGVCLVRYYCLTLAFNNPADCLFPVKYILGSSRG